MAQTQTNNRTKGWESLRQRTKRIAVPLTPAEEQQIKQHAEKNEERSVADFVRRTVLDTINGVASVAAAATQEAPEFVKLAWDATTRQLVEAANARAEAAGELVRKMLGELWTLRKIEEHAKVLLDPKASPAALAAAKRELAGNLAVLERMPREEYVR